MDLTFCYRYDGGEPLLDTITTITTSCTLTQFLCITTILTVIVIGTTMVVVVATATTFKNPNNSERPYKNTSRRASVITYHQHFTKILSTNIHKYNVYTTFSTSLFLDNNLLINGYYLLFFKKRSK